MSKPPLFLNLLKIRLPITAKASIIHRISALGVFFLIFPIFSEIAGGFGPNIEFSFTILLSGILLAILMAFISGIFPAYSAMKLKVVDALRMN